MRRFYAHVWLLIICAVKGGAKSHIAERKDIKKDSDSKEHSKEIVSESSHDLTSPRAEHYPLSIKEKEDNAVQHTNHRAVHETHDGHEEDEISIRCRICGAKITSKKDLTNFPKHSRSSKYRKEIELAEDAEIHTFVTSSERVYELVGFRSANAAESSEILEDQSFFHGYLYTKLYCDRCERHIGYMFYHEKYERCINEMYEMRKKEITKDNDDSRHDEENLKMLSGLMQNKCYVKSGDAWSFELCFEKEVNMFRENSKGSRTNVIGLGVFQSRIDVTHQANLGGIQIQHHYGKGHRCGKDGDVYKAKVTYQCCADGNSDQDIYISSVVQTSMCSHDMKVCVLQLCNMKTSDDKDLYHQVEKDCVQTLSKEIPQTSFAGLRWDAIVAEDSKDLEWIKKLQFSV